MIRLPRLFEEGVFTKLVHPVAMAITENIVPLSTASLTLLHGESLPPRSYVELFTPYGSAGMYRVRNPKDSYGDEQTTATLEHMISEVGDYVVKEEISEMMEAVPAIERIFHYYEGGLWALGNIEALGADEVAVDVDHDSVLDAMLDVLEQKPDCFLQFDFDQTPWKINIASKSTTVVAEGRLSRNVEAASISYDDTDLVTRLWYKDYTEDDEGEWKYIDSETISEYGIVEGKVSTNASMTEDEMNNTVETYLYEHRHPKITIEIQAAELSRITGERIDQFRIGDRVRLAIPEFGINVDENVIKVDWPDVINSPNSVNLTLGDEEDTVIKYIHDSESSGGGGGGSTESMLESLYYDFYSDDGYFYSRLEMTAQYLRTEFWEGYGYLYSRVEQTAAYWQAEFQNWYAGLSGYVEITAQHLQSEFTDAYAGLSSRIEQTASYWQAEFSSMYNGLTGFVEVTAQHWQSTFSDTYSGLISRIEQTAGYWSSEIANVYSGLSSRVTQTENSWNATVQAIGSSGVIDAASICVAINADTGSTAKINASKIYLLGDTIANAITADYIKAKIGTIPTLTGIAASFSGNVSGSGGLFGQVYVGSGTSYTNISDPVLEVRIDGPTSNTYKLQYKSVTSTSWTDAGSFSRATSLSGAWSGGSLTITASPQGDTFVAALQTEGHWGYASGENTKHYYGTVSAKHNGGSTSYTTGKSFEVDASDIYTAGNSAAGLTLDATNHKVKKAASSSTTEYLVTVDVPASWSSGSKTISAKLGSTVMATGSVSVPEVVSTSWENPQGKIWRADLTIGGVVRKSSTKDFSGYYTDGQDSITDFSIWNGNTNVTGDIISVSPGNTLSLTEWHKKDGTWIQGSTTTVGVSMPASATWSSYWPATNVISVTCQVGGKSYTQSFTRS